MRNVQVSTRVRKTGLIALAIAASVSTVAAGSVAYADPAATAPTSSDFDGDGRNDLAMAAQKAGSEEETVIVDYTSDLDDEKLSPQDAYGTEGFGVGLAAGDLNGDGFDDLAVGCVDCEWEWGGATVSVFNGSAQGLDFDTGVNTEVGNPDHAVAIGDIAAGAGDDIGSTKSGDNAAVSSRADGGSWSAEEVDVTAPADTDRRGSVAIGDVDGDGTDDLVVGTPTADGGAVTLFPGPVTQDDQDAVRAVELSPTLRDLGASLAVADVTGDGLADVIAGAPNSTTSDTECGAVQMLVGTDKGINADYSQRVNQDTAGVPGVCEDGDGWGGAVAAGNLDADALPEVVVGVPGEAIGSLSGAGTYTVLQSTSTGLTGTGSFGVSQSTAGVPGVVESGDAFASALALRDMNGDDRLDVLIGTPTEDVDPVADAGQVVAALSGTDGAPADGTWEVTGKRYGLNRLGWELA